VDWYDRTKFTKKNIHNCQFISCMNPAAGSSFVNPRLQRWYMVFAVELPSQQSLYTIYDTFIKGHLTLNDFAEDMQALSSILVRAALNLRSVPSISIRLMRTLRSSFGEWIPLWSHHRIN
jgi:dynein heavy chain